MSFSLKNLTIVLLNDMNKHNKISFIKKIFCTLFLEWSNQCRICKFCDPGCMCYAEAPFMLEHFDVYLVECTKGLHISLFIFYFILFYLKFGFVNL